MAFKSLQHDGDLHFLLFVPPGRCPVNVCCQIFMDFCFFVTEAKPRTNGLKSDFFPHWRPLTGATEKKKNLLG